jgi:hypothetical protein
MDLVVTVYELQKYVRFLAVTAATVKATVLKDVVLCSPPEVTDVSEVLTDSVIIVLNTVIFTHRPDDGCSKHI